MAFVSGRIAVWLGLLGNLCREGRSSRRQQNAGILRCAQNDKASGEHDEAVGALFFLALIFLVSAIPAGAVVVRGVVTDGLGRPVVGARVQLIQGPKAIAIGVAGVDGSYEIRSTEAGRFVLLSSAATFYPGVGRGFYGGSTDVVTQDVVLEARSLHEQVTQTATGVSTPLEQTSAAVHLMEADELATALDLTEALRLTSGVVVAQTGQAGGITSLLVRGGGSSANEILLDGITAEDVGGGFELGRLSANELAGGELYRGANSALYGGEAGAAAMRLETTRGSATQPALNYSGEAGNFNSVRNQISLSGTRQRADYLADFSRLDTSNALPRDEFHLATGVANLGYAITANTLARFTIRSADAAAGTPGAHDFYEISADGKQSDQEIYSGLTLENRLEDGWHNLLRYGIARRREQERQFSNVGAAIIVQGRSGAETDYFGNAMTIHGANGSSATGRASFLLPTADKDSNRDELSYQSDYSYAPYLTGLFGFRYADERGGFESAVSNVSEERRNFDYTMQVQGAIKSRVYYSAGGGIEKNHLYGITGAPRIGLSYDAVRPGVRWFRGTLLRANVATGVAEPPLGESLYTELRAAGDAAEIAKVAAVPAGPQRSRSYDLGVEQQILGEKLRMQIDYFHNSFSHQVERGGVGEMEQLFGYAPSVAASAYAPYSNSLAYGAQGVETEILYRPTNNLVLRGGYTYLDAVVRQSSASAAYSSGIASGNPNLPGVAIGAEGPLVGARPFQQPPHSGFFAVQYTGARLGAAFTGALASRSDDSTFLDGRDANLGNTLLLPNRNLDAGYARLNANLTYAYRSRVTIFTELDNLLGQQRIGAIGTPGLPFTVRAGMKVRIGGD
jgi:iron complex outermembrane receptor protein/vitamin B12 transporter